MNNRIRVTVLAALMSMLVPGLVQAGQETPPASVAQQEQALKNKREGEAFLAANKTKEGVVTRESGLQYTILKAGDGKRPTIEDTVVCRYRGTLIDGTEFANSYTSPRPATFPVKRALKGWAEALQLMPVGSKWQLFIPPSLAHGERGLGSRVGPNATLILEVELIAIRETSGRTAAALERRDRTKDPGEPAIKVAFKLDPRLTQGLYMGERWVSPPKYNRAGTAERVAVEARAAGVDAMGRPKNITPTWTSADREIVTVTPNAGSAVTITVHRAGETSLRVSADGISKELAIKAVSQNNVMQVEIEQRP
jgi:FKBP-type peptidyl-prolyl cis-trans isomerase